MPITEADVRDKLYELHYQLVNGCSDMHCIIQPKKQGTNGGCKCRPREIARDLRFLGEWVRDNTNGMDWGG